MRCPCCQQNLREMSYEGVAVFTCRGCGGEFTAGESLGRIVQQRQQTFSVEHRRALAGRAPSFGVPKDHRRRQFNCPACDNPMQLVNFTGDSGVFVDRCTVCTGIWLDHHELEQVQIITEAAIEKAPQQLREIAGLLEDERLRCAESAGEGFIGSRFAFINALINRIVDFTDDMSGSAAA